MGVPALVTGPCHIPEVAIHNCGWVVQPRTEDIQDALAEFAKMPSRDVEAMGRRGADLVRTRFDWAAVGKQMSEVYSWLQGGSRPSSVEVV